MDYTPRPEDPAKDYETMYATAVEVLGEDRVHDALDDATANTLEQLYDNREQFAQQMQQ